MYAFKEDMYTNKIQYNGRWGRICQFILVIYFLAMAIPSPKIPPNTRAAPPATAIPLATSLSLCFLMYS